MLKKMLKGVLAIATVCAMSIPAYAGANFSANINAALVSKSGTLTSTHYGKLNITVPGEIVTAGTNISWNGTKAAAGSNALFGTTESMIATDGNAYVTYKFNDTVDLTLGSYSALATWGNSGLGSWYMGTDFLNNQWLYSGVSNAWIFAMEGIHSSIKLSDDMNVYVGAKNNAGKLKPYAWVTGKATDLTYAVGYLVDGGLSAGGKYTMGDIAIGLDIGKPSTAGSASQMGLGVKMNNMGPGSVAVSMSKSGSNQVISADYQYVMEMGKYLDIIFIKNGSATETGVSMYYLF